MFFRGCAESQTLQFHCLCPVEGCGGELITCSKAVKIIDECMLNPKTGPGKGGRGGEEGEEEEGVGRERERDREEGREGVVARERGREAGKVPISAL